MSKRTLISDVPQTPGGVHLCFGDVSADEIAVDEEISIKSSLFRTSTEPHMKTRSSSRKKSLVTPKTKEKFVVRKSTDLRRFKTVEDRVNALISSPMIEVRRRPLSQSQSFTSMEYLILQWWAVIQCADAILNRNAKIVCVGWLVSRSLVAPRTLESPVQEAANLDAEPEPMDDSENIPPGTETEPAPETVQAEQMEPSSIGEFRVLVDMEAARLKAARAAWEDVVEEEGSAIPDVGNTKTIAVEITELYLSALDSIRVAVGKCGLLLAKKFPFFHNLIDMADASPNSATEESAPSADINDLLGYWTTIAAEIEQIDSAFERLRVWRENSKWALESRPKTPSRYEAKKETTKPSSRLPRAKALNPSALPKNIVNKIKATPKSSKRLLRSGKKTASKIPAPSVPKRSTFAEFRAQLKAKRAETFKTPEAPKVAKTTSESYYLVLCAFRNCQETRLVLRLDVLHFSASVCTVRFFYLSILHTRANKLASDITLNSANPYQ
ncbi:unnamed protein product [Dibothriocephalus latus]|uniref:Guanylate kinase-associated protein mars n=1 Tax=Dibothriocephalus latus TaxID=60516 RepID=A0A3P7M1E8_DIBLA|nr:unnamed protein product [Dibothriocephalus latus]